MAASAQRTCGDFEGIEICVGELRGIPDALVIRYSRWVLFVGCSIGGTARSSVSWWRVALCRSCSCQVEVGVCFVSGCVGSPFCIVVVRDVSQYCFVGKALNAILVIDT